jgi:type IV pilus assembly protein PilF
MTLRMLCLAAFVALSGCASTAQQTDQSDQLNVDEAKAGRINTQLGMAYMQRGQLEAAMEKLQRALEQTPDYPDAHAAVAVLYERLGELDKASHHHERAVRLAPDDSQMLNNYGRFLCARGKLDDALVYLDKAAANPLYPTPEVPLGNAGICAASGGRAEVAEQYFLRALRSNERFMPALYRMAEFRLAANSAMSARGFYQRYISLVPQNAQSLWLGIRIERALDNLDAVASYGLLLKSKFPDSEQARRLLEMERNER